jgi:GMP synthase (glutamine-hydrolysing)
VPNSEPGVIVGESAVRVLVLMHVACEPAAEYESVLNERGIAVTNLLLDSGAELPDWHEFDGIIAMGGPMSANDDEQLPWITAEKRLIRDAVAAGTPFWGVCLGAQLLAASLGARVYTGAAPEVGMSEVTLAPGATHDPVFGSLPTIFPAFQWHGDTFELPVGAIWLAGNDAYRHQAFRVGSAYGVQFHVEVATDLAAEWLAIPEYAAGLEAVHGPGAEVGVLAGLAARVDETRVVARQIFEAWLDNWVIPAAQSD